MEALAPNSSDPIVDPVHLRGAFRVRRGSLAHDIGDRLGAHGPVLAGLAVWAFACVVLAGLVVGLGLLLTHVLLPAGLGSIDLSVSQWFARNRTPTLNTITVIGSEIGSTEGIIGVAVIAVVILAVKRYRYHLAFVICALSLEFVVFLTATFAVDRNRPSVVRLDPSPVTSSYPSGHAAASLVLYVAIAIIVSSTVRSAFVRTLVWVAAVAVPALVGISRVYRGMHHLTDVVASVLLALGALLFALLVIRSEEAATMRRHDDTVPEPSDDRLLRAAS